MKKFPEMKKYTLTDSNPRKVKWSWRTQSQFCRNYLLDSLQRNYEIIPFHWYIPLNEFIVLSYEVSRLIFYLTTDLTLCEGAGEYDKQLGCQPVDPALHPLQRGAARLGEWNCNRCWPKSRHRAWSRHCLWQESHPPSRPYPSQTLTGRRKRIYCQHDKERCNGLHSYGISYLIRKQLCNRPLPSFLSSVRLATRISISLRFVT